MVLRSATCPFLLIMSVRVAPVGQGNRENERCLWVGGCDCDRDSCTPRGRSHLEGAVSKKRDVLRRMAGAATGGRLDGLVADACELHYESIQQNRFKDVEPFKDRIICYERGHLRIHRCGSLERIRCPETVGGADSGCDICHFKTWSDPSEIGVSGKQAVILVDCMGVFVLVGMDQQFHHRNG